MATPLVKQEIQLRPATVADVVAIHALIEPQVAAGVLLRRSHAELESLLGSFFVAEREGEILGCVSLEVYSARLAELRSLAVAPHARGQGLGRILVAACVERARELRIHEVMAITSNERFFRANGFEFTLPGLKKALFIPTADAC